MTPLEELIVETNRKYDRCVERGRHRRSNRVTTPRQIKGGGYAAFPICRDCGVPVVDFTAAPKGRTHDT